MRNDAYIHYTFDTDFYGRAVVEIENGKVLELKEIQVEHMSGDGPRTTFIFSPSLHLISIEVNTGYYGSFHKSMVGKFTQYARSVWVRVHTHIPKEKK